MIKNIIFDIGNVLADYRLKEFLLDKGFDAPMIKRIVKASVASPYWLEFECGRMTEQEAFDAFISIDTEVANEIHTAYDNIQGMLVKRDIAIPWIQAIKKAGYNVYYLSNFSEKANKECQDALDFLDYMDGGIMSFRELVGKPDAEIYNRLAQRFNLIPEECVFIDDSEENVSAAKRLGFKGIVYKTYDEAMTELIKLGVNI